MAGLRKIKGKWYVRVWLSGGKEKLIPTKTGDRKKAESLKRQIEEREFLVKARLAEDLSKSSTNLFNAAAGFLTECKTRLRPSTIESYEFALQNLKDCWGDTDLRQITAHHISALRKYLLARVNPTTTNIRLRSIRAFLNWLVQTGKIDRLPGKLCMVKIDDELPKFFTPDEQDKILDAIKDPKARAAIKVLAETGLRRSEIFNCTLEDGYLHLHQTKGRKDRLVALPPELIPDFLLAMDKPYKPNTLTQVFKRAIKKAEVEQKGRSLHSLRHTFALREYYRTGDIYYVKGRLGHSHVTITERYLKFPMEYLGKVFGNSVTPYPTRQLWADLSQEKPTVQA